MFHLQIDMDSETVLRQQIQAVYRNTEWSIQEKSKRVQQLMCPVVEKPLICVFTFLGDHLFLNYTFRMRCAIIMNAKFES